MENQSESLLNLDLSSGKVGAYKVGKKSPTREDFVDRKMGVAVRLKGRVVVSVFVALRDGYKGFECFRGKIFQSGRIVELSCASSPTELKQLFGPATNEWDDGVEANLQFRLSELGADLEFNWSRSNGGKVLDYLILEL